VLDRAGTGIQRPGRGEDPLTLLLEITEPTLAPAAATVRIGGWARTTLVDYPGRVASTLFFPGCNYRCPYCHNPELVHPVPRVLEDPEEVFSYLARYAGMLEGVCLTGGEPLLQSGLSALCRRIQGLGLRVKLDTNGSMPERLEAALKDGLLDYVAVDIKGPPRKIQSIARAAVRPEDLVHDTETTVELLRSAGIPFELRTTVVPGLLTPEDFHAIGAWMRGCPSYFLQQFRPGKTLDPLFEDLPPYPPEDLRELCRELSGAGYFPSCTVRGIG